MCVGGGEEHSKHTETFSKGYFALINRDASQVKVFKVFKSLRFYSEGQ